MKKYTILFLISALLMALSIVSYGQQMKGISAADRYLILSAKALEGMKMQFPLTMQKESSIKRLNNDFLIQVASAESNGSGRIEINPKLVFERQLQALLSKEEYAEYCRQRDKLIVNLAHQNSSLGRNKIPENFKSIAAKETNIMKERYKLTKEQEQAAIVINEAYFKEMTAPVTEKDSGLVKQKRISARETREQELQALFNEGQYSAFRKDSDAIESEIKKRQIVIKEAFEGQKIHRKELKEANKPEGYKPTTEAGKESRL